MSYLKLKKLCDSDQLKIIFIASPPRCGSTLLEILVSNNEVIALQVNEPWCQYNRLKSDEAVYEHIYSKIKPALTNKAPITVVVKDMADMFLHGEMLSQWLDLVDRVVLNIREPQLAIASLLNQLCKEMKSILDTKHINVDNGDLLKIEKELLAFMKSYQIRHNEPEYLNAICLFRGLLGERAKAFIRKTQPTRFTGWDAIEEMHQAVIKQGKSYCIVDSTLLRLAPHFILKQLCDYLGLPYQHDMTKLKDDQSFDWGCNSSEIPEYFTRVLASVKIEPPIEVAPKISVLPVLLRQHITEKEGAKDIYETLLKDHYLLFDERLLDLMMSYPIHDDRTLMNINPVFVSLLIKTRKANNTI